MTASLPVTTGRQLGRRSWAEPWKIKMVPRDLPRRRRFYPQLSQDEFPAQTLAAELYLDSGIRGMERGVVPAGRDPRTGKHHYPKLELTRLAIPRRVYTQAHMDMVAEAVQAVHAQAHAAKGLTMTYEPKYLRFFQARFDRL